MDLNLPVQEEDNDLDRLIMDEQLDKLYQAFNDYKKDSSMDDIDPRDFVDKYFVENNNIDATTNYDHLHNDAQSTIMQISEDFEVFERTQLPPTTDTPIELNNNINQLGEDVQEIETMIEEMVSGTWQHTNSYGQSSCNPVGCYSNVNVACYDRDGGGSGQFVNDMSSDSSGPVIRYFFCGQIKNAAKVNYRRKRQKRKYRGILLSEEQRLIKMAEQKIKNREVATRAHEMKMAREAHLVSLHAKLLQKNDFLRKMVTFLEYHERVDVPPEPLRRTISGPVMIQRNNAYEIE